MLNIALFNQNGEKLNDLELNENVFGIEPNNQAIFDVVLLQSFIKTGYSQGEESSRSFGRWKETLETEGYRTC